MTEHDPLRASSPSGDEPTTAVPAGSPPGAEDPTAALPAGEPPTAAPPAGEDRTAVSGGPTAEERTADERTAGHPTAGSATAGSTAAGSAAAGSATAGESAGGDPVAGGPTTAGAAAGAAPLGGATRADVPPAGDPGPGSGFVPPPGGGGFVPPPGGGGFVPPPGGPAGPAGGAPPPPPYRPVRRLARSRQQRVVAGVAGGLGDYTGVDPVLFRVLFAVLSVFGGAGILLYLLGWLFLPDENEPTSPVESLIGRGTKRRTGDLVKVALLVFLGLVLAGILTSGDGGHVVLLIVVVAGVVLLVRNLDERRDGRPPVPGPAPPPPAAYQPYEPYPPYDPTRTAAMPSGPAPTGTAVLPESLAPPIPPAPVKQRKERSLLGRLTLSTLLLVLGVTAALDAGGAIDPQARQYLALSVGVLGLGLVVGAWRGRARGLIWLGIPLTVALIAVSTAEVSLDGGTGDRLYRPQSIAEVQDDYRIGVGSLRLDLTDLDFTAQSVHSSLSAGLGNVEVIVPRNVDVEVISRTGIGESELFGEKDDDSRDRTVFDDGPDGEGGGQLRLVLDVGVGRLEVDRAAA